MKHLSLSAFLLALLTLAACKKETGTDPNSNINKEAPDGFDYSTSKSVSLNVRLLSNTNEPLKGVLVSVTSPKTGDILAKTASDNDGYVKTTLNIPSYLDTLIVDPNYVGLIRNVKAYIKNNAVTCVIGGADGLSGNVVLSVDETTNVSAAKMGVSKVTASTEYSYMGTHDLSGRPLSYREAVQGAVSANLLSFINSSLPENQDVNNHHPEFISESATQNLNIVKNTDVYVTFVSEGAMYLNSLGYYIYKTDKPPKNRNKIDEVKYLFPNSSALGSGGGLRSGDRVKISNVPEGHSVGFVLLSNAWSPWFKLVNSNADKFYSDKDLNPEPNGTLEIHTVLLKYAQEDLFVVGIEDLPRSNPGGDDDFNDVVIYAKSSVPDAISSAGVINLTTPQDADNDGVLNSYDQFPNDPAKAYINYFPSKDNWGTLAFEDNWPQKGDYDVNDLVVNYRYTMIANAQNNIVEMTADFAPKAAGASYYNGFGVEFPFPSTDVNSVSGYKFISNYISLNSNGTEAGQSKAVIIPFDNHEAFIKNEAGAFFINTKESMSKVSGDTAHIDIKFNSAMTPAKLGQAPFNPFLISNMRRGYEIHLPGYAPTNKANSALFGTDDDNSKASSARYYLSKENAPWGLSFTETFAYPSELNAIGDAYLQFNNWVRSGGDLYPDWYKTTTAGYRDESKIYSK